MSAHVLTELRCDGLDGRYPCPATHAEDGKGAGVTREIAAERGWRKVGRRDLCPRHAAEVTR